MLGSIGMPELIIIFVIALIIFGPRKLPELGRSLGKSLNEFKRASNELKNTLDEEIRVEESAQHGAPARARACTSARGGSGTDADRTRTRSAERASSVFRRRLDRPMALVPFPSSAHPAPDDDDRHIQLTDRTRSRTPARRCRFWTISMSSGND